MPQLGSGPCSTRIYPWTSLTPTMTLNLESIRCYVCVECSFRIFLWLQLRYSHGSSFNLQICQLFCFILDIMTSVLFVPCVSLFQQPPYYLWHQSCKQCKTGMQRNAYVIAFPWLSVHSTDKKLDILLYKDFSLSTCTDLWKEALISQRW